MKITMETKGTDKIIADLKRFGRDGKTIVAEVTQIKAMDIEAQGKRLAPVDTGKLQQSIKAEKFAPLTWFITAYEMYASFVEFGTRRMSAQPFLYPAWKIGVKQYIKDLNDQLTRLTKKYG